MFPDNYWTIKTGSSLDEKLQRLLYSSKHMENVKRMTVTDEQKAVSCHCGIDSLLKAAYQRDFSMLEMGKCKNKYPTFDE
jgi:hypothetical protein